MAELGALPRLSQHALHYGAALETSLPDVLTARLYAFNRLPISPRLLSSLPSERQFRELGLSGTAHIAGFWKSRRLEQHSGWIHWIRRDGSSKSPAVAYKLYVSPAPDTIRDVLRELVPLLSESACLSFKMGATPSFLARPDKLVAYFIDRDEMLQVAHAASAKLAGTPAHGVPFSFPVDNEGLVSYGVDPPYDPNERTSWRLWLCSELSRAITTAESGAALGVAEARLRALGIDPSTWRPSDEFWTRYGSR